MELSVRISLKRGRKAGISFQPWQRIPKTEELKAVQSFARLLIRYSEPSILECWVCSNGLMFNIGHVMAA